MIFRKNTKNPYAIEIQVPNDAFASNIMLSLKKNVPSWVMDANVNDDQGGVPPSNKSFAIEKMIEGISAAYSMDYNTTIKLQINIKEYNR